MYFLLKIKIKIFRTVQVPVEKVVTDYYPVEYETEYVPRKTYETYTDYVEVERVREVIEYDAVER